MTSIGRIEKVDLREVWPHEAYDFTRWLGENLDLLSEELGIDLADAETESAAGDFCCDVLARDTTDRTIIIENQLERSDHDHLGKLLTYFAMMNAEAAIWIVSEARPEHVSAVSWLNENSEADFYLVQVEAIRIGDSPPAPLLTRIVGPSAEKNEILARQRELTDRERLRRHFWSGLLQRAKEKTNLHANISPSGDSWIAASSGVRGFGFEYRIRQHDAGVEVAIDFGPGQGDENAHVFEVLKQHRDEVEGEYGAQLEWDRSESRRKCRIADTLEVGGYRDLEDDWPTIQEAMIDAMIRLERALRPHIDTLDV